MSSQGWAGRAGGGAFRASPWPLRYCGVRSHGALCRAARTLGFQIHGSEHVMATTSRVQQLRRPCLHPTTWPSPVGGTHRLVEAHVEELLVPLLHLGPRPVPQLPPLAPEATQELFGLVLAHGHVRLGWSRGCNDKSPEVQRLLGAAPPHTCTGLLHDLPMLPKSDNSFFFSYQGLSPGPLHSATALAPAPALCF